MARQLLFLHWKTVRWALVPFMVASFALPLLSVQGMGGNPFEPNMVRTLLGDTADWLLFFPMLASAIGLVLGMSAWHWDHRHNHVYALSLPISRARYVTLKFGAGAVLTLLPVAALLAGSLIATVAVNIPEGLRAYPLQLSGRFLFAVLTLYAILFAASAGTVRTTAIVLAVVFGVPLLTLLSMSYLGEAFPALQAIDVGRWVLIAIEDLGPFRILIGNWALIDV
jgi:hypothetical protein